MADSSRRIARAQSQGGRGIVVGVRFPPRDLERLDAFASREGINRSEALRRLVQGGLNQI